VPRFYWRLAFNYQLQHLLSVTDWV